MYNNNKKGKKYQSFDMIVKRVIYIHTYIRNYFWKKVHCQWTKFIKIISILIVSFSKQDCFVNIGNERNNGTSQFIKQIHRDKREEA